MMTLSLHEKPSSLSQKDTYTSVEVVSYIAVAVVSELLVARTYAFRSRAQSMLDPSNIFHRGVRSISRGQDINTES